jgi:hypothetical protein
MQIPLWLMELIVKQDSEVVASKQVRTTNFFKGIYKICILGTFIIEMALTIALMFVPNEMLLESGIGFPFINWLFAWCGSTQFFLLMFIIYLSRQIKYDDNAFTLATFWSKSQTFKYEDIISIKNHKGVNRTIVMKDRKIRLWGFFSGSVEFAEFARTRMKKT